MSLTKEQRVTRSTLEVDGFVYFIRRGLKGPIKIGHSFNPLLRLSHLQAANPEMLTILGAIYGGQDIERAIHRALARHRIGGEWFRPADEVLQYIEREIINRGVKKRRLITISEYAPRFVPSALKREAIGRAHRAADGLLSG